MKNLRLKEIKKKGEIMALKNLFKFGKKEKEHEKDYYEDEFLNDFDDDNF